MLVTAFLSMWISNTASTAMMMPIAHAVLQELHKSPKDSDIEEGRNNPTFELEETSAQKKVNKHGEKDETGPCPKPLTLGEGRGDVHSQRREEGRKKHHDQFIPVFPEFPYFKTESHMLGNPSVLGKPRCWVTLKSRELESEWAIRGPGSILPLWVWIIFCPSLCPNFSLSRKRLSQKVSPIETPRDAGLLQA